MASYFYNLVSGTELFHGSIENKLALKPLSIWFGNTEQIAKANGPVVHKFISEKDLKLLDISNPLFHLDFMGKVNNLYKGVRNCGMDAQKENALMPLGLPDVETQLLVVDKIAGGFYERPDVADIRATAAFDKIKQFVGYFGGRHRYSRMDQYGHNMDNDMVNAMIELYPDYDGYICPIMWPSIHHAGFIMPEICIFNPIAAGIKYLSVGGGKSLGRRKKQNGGAIEPSREYMNVPGFGEIIVTTCQR